jgi:hypothetical protein
MAERVVHDLFDGARTPAALGAASETAIDLAAATRRFLLHSSTHVLIGNDIAGADDHLGPGVSTG